MLPANPLLNATAPAGPHLPVGLLRQYAAGTLAPAAQHRVEAHTLDCPRCADILAGLLQTPTATTAQALAQLQQRLRRRVQPQPAARPLLRQRRWLAPQLAAAAALLLCLVAGGWWAWQQRHPRPTLAATAILESAPPLAAPDLPTAPPAKPRAVAATDTLVLAQVARPTRSRYPTSPGYRRAPASRPVTAKEATTTPVPAADQTSSANEVEPTIPPLVAAAPTLAPDTTSLRGRQSGLARKALGNADASGRASAEAMPPLPPVAPRPLGGASALRDKLRKDAAGFVPENAQQITGSVQLRLTIGADGKIEKVKVLRGMRDDYNTEAERLVRQASPTWIPGLRNGKPAAMEVDTWVLF